MWCKRSRTIRLHALAIVGLATLFAASAASAKEPEIFYYSDMVDFGRDWFKTSSLLVDQHEDSVTLTGTKGYNAAESRARIRLLDVFSGGIFVDSKDLFGEAKVRVLYYDVNDNLLGGETVFDGPHDGVNLRLIRNLSPLPGAKDFRFQVRVDGPKGVSIPASMLTLDSVSVTSAPEPGTAALLGAGLSLLGALSRRRAA